LVAVVAIIAAAYLLPRVIQKTIEMAVRGTAKGIQKGFAGGFTNMTSKPISDGAGGQPKTKAAVKEAVPLVAVARPVQQIQVKDTPEGLRVTSVCTYGGTNVLIGLSDGRIADSQYGEVQSFGERYVRVFGYRTAIPRF